MIFLYIYSCESLINIIKEKNHKKAFIHQTRAGRYVVRREVDPASNKLSYILHYKEKNNSMGEEWRHTLR